MKAVDQLVGAGREGVGDGFGLRREGHRKSTARQICAVVTSHDRYVLCLHRMTDMCCAYIA